MGNVIIRPELKQFVLSILQVGYEKCDAKHFYGPCKRGFYVLHVVVGGAGIFRVDGQTVPLCTGDLFLVPPSAEIFYRADPEDPYEYYWFAFQGLGVKQLLVNAGFLENGVYVQHLPDKYEACRDVMASLMALGQSSSRNDLLFVGGFYQLLATLTRDKRYESDESYDSLYERINLYLEVNYMYDISMDTFSYFTGLHRSSIYRFFKREYGKSPTEYIQDFRLGKAYSMIVNSDTPVKAVALSCGFNDISHFIRLFRRKYGTTPREMRAERVRG